MVLAHAAFTLPGLAGVVLMLGMAVDANVLIYERLREDVIRRQPRYRHPQRLRPRLLYDHRTPTSRASSRRSCSFYFGNDQLKGFAISLASGLIISLFTLAVHDCLMFDYWQHRHWLKELKMLRFVERPMFNPMKYRFYFFTATSILTVLVWRCSHARLLGAERGLPGGTVYGGRLKDGRNVRSPHDKPGLRDLLSDASSANG